MWGFYVGREKRVHGHRKPVNEQPAIYLRPEEKPVAAGSEKCQKQARAESALERDPK